MRASIKKILDNPETLVVCNHSGGKDSQVTYLAIKDLVPPERLVVIHAHLPGVEWDGVVEHIQDTTSHEFFVVQAKKTFFQMVAHRKRFPSPKNRQCTSDLKRGPINKEIIRICNERGFTVVVNCLGLRAEESSGRAKKKAFRKISSNCNSKRTWYEYLPIHSLKTTQVFARIKLAGQQAHWAYGCGMTRLSCPFCIMSSEEDLKTAKGLLPALHQTYAKTERLLDHTIRMPVKGIRRFLDEL